MPVPEMLHEVCGSFLKEDMAITLPDMVNDGCVFAHAWWIALHTSTGLVEGKIFIPEKPSSKLLIFEPGFPGDGSARFERLYLEATLKAGFAVFAIRHGGTIVNGEYAATYVQCPEKQAWAHVHGQHVLGDMPESSIVFWLREPYIALEVFAGSFDEIVFTGHSFGPLAMATSILDFVDINPTKSVNLKRFISLAGTLGRVNGLGDPRMIQWRDYLGRQSIHERIRIGDIDANLDALEHAYRKIYLMIHSFPTALDVVCITPHGQLPDSRDELVSPLEPLEFISTLGRGTLVIDLLERAESSTGRLAHDMDNFPVLRMVEFILGNYNHQKQIQVVPFSSSS